MTEQIIDREDDEAKEAIFKVVGDAADAWHASRGRPTLHADVLIEPLLNHVDKFVDRATQCPGCRAELRLRAANFLLEPLGIHIDQVEAPPHTKGPVH